MEQSNLLELARQGEPEAIAALMNAVLEPKGIQAHVMLENDCLQVLLVSTKHLNQVAIANFIQKGLLELKIASICKVRISGKKLGERKLAWTRAFSIAPSTVEKITVEKITPPRAETVVPPPVPPLQQPEQVEHEPAEMESLHSQLNPVDEEVELPPHLLLDVQEPEELDLPLPEHLLLSEEPEEEETGPEQTVLHENLEGQGKQINLAIRTALRNAIAEDFQDLESQTEPEAAEEINEPPVSRLSLLASYSRSYALPVLLVGIGSFFAGGTAALLSTSQSGPQSQANEVIQVQNETPQVKQQEAEEYLKAMNAAQEKFYKQNSRFASSLEELERSANLISQSYSYAYRLNVSDRSVITASPREAGLKSYVGAVFLSQSGTTNTVICQTKKASMEAPMTPEFSKNKANCDPRSAKLP